MKSIIANLFVTKIDDPKIKAFILPHTLTHIS